MFPLSRQAWPGDTSSPFRSSLRGGVSELAESRLRGNSYLALRNVSCSYHDGVLTLTGCLPSYYLKQVAQSAVDSLENVTRVDNRMEVAPLVSWLRR